MNEWNSDYPAIGFVWIRANYLDGVQRALVTDQGVHVGPGMYDRELWAKYNAEHIAVESAEPASDDAATIEARLMLGMTVAEVAERLRALGVK